MALELRRIRTAFPLLRSRGANRVHDNNSGITWRSSPHVRATIGADGGVLLDIQKGICYSLNPVGAKIWQAIESKDGHGTFEDIINTLASQFPVSREQLTRDIDEYLRDLEKKELIKAAGRA